MNKRLIFLLAMLCAMPIVLAELKIDAVRIDINDYRYYGVGKEGGEIKLNKGDELELKIDFNNEVNTTTHVKIKGILEDIQDGGDISKNLTVDIEPNNDDITRTLTFRIPDNSLKGDYDLKLKIEYIYANGTEGTIGVNWVVVVSSGEVKSISLEEALSNVSTMCNLLMGKMATSFEYIGKYDGCSSNLSTCREERGKYESQSSECERTKNLCATDKTSCEQDKKECEEKMTQMISISQCENDKKTYAEGEVTKAEKKKDNTMVGFGLFGGAIALIVYFRRKKGGSVHDKFYEAKRLP